MARRGCAACSDLLRVLFHHDGHARLAHGDRHYFDGGTGATFRKRPFFSALFHANRNGRVVLAFRRHRVGVPVSPSLPGRPQLMSETIVPRKTYVTVWAALLLLLLATVGVSYL